MSQFVIKESTDSQKTSFDDELNEAMPENLNHYRQIAKSRDEVDMRLLNIYMIGKAS